MTCLPTDLNCLSSPIPIPDASEVIPQNAEPTDVRADVFVKDPTTPFSLSYALQPFTTLIDWGQSHVPGMSSVDWSAKPQLSPGIDGEIVLAVVNPYGKGGKGQKNLSIVEQGCKDNGAEKTYILETVADMQENRKAIQAQLEIVATENPGRKITLLSVGGDGTATDVMTVVRDVRAQESNVISIRQVFLLKGGTAGDKMKVTGMPTPEEFFAKGAGRGSVINNEAVSQVLFYDKDGNVVGSHPFAHSYCDQGVVGNFFRGEETLRKWYQGSAQKLLDSAKQSVQDTPGLAAEAKLALAERVWRFSRNKSVATCFVNPEALQATYRVLSGKQSLSLELDLTHLNSSMEHLTPEGAELAFFHPERIGGTFTFSKKPGHVVMVIIPKKLRVLVPGAIDGGILRSLPNPSKVPRLRWIPAELYHSLPAGTEVDIRSVDGQGNPMVTLNGGVEPLPPGVVRKKVKIGHAVVPVAMATDSVAAQQYHALSGSTFERWYTRRYAADVLGPLGQDALNFIPEGDRPRFFPDANPTELPARLKNYFESPEGRRTVDISPELVSFVADPVPTYFNTRTAVTVAKQTGSALGLGFGIGMLGQVGLSKTKYKDDWWARSLVNVGSMAVTEVAFEAATSGKGLAQAALRPFTVAGLMPLSLASAVGRGLGEFSVLAGAKRGGLAEAGVNLAGAVGTGYAMAYHATRMAQLAATGTTAVEAAALGATAAGVGFRLGRAVPYILLAGLALDGLNLYVEQTLRNESEKELRAQARTRYLNQNIEDAFGSHGDWTRHATGVAQYLGVNILAQSFSSGLVDIGQDISDEWSGSSTRDIVRAEMSNTRNSLASKQE